MKHLLAVVSILITCLSVSAQDKTSYLELAKAESQLQSMFSQLYGQEMPGSQLALYQSIDSLFSSALELPGSYDYTWSKLDQVGKLESEDGLIKVFSWLYRVSPDDFRYSAYFQVRNRQDTVLFRLRPAAADNIHAKDFDQTVEHWDGKVYYDLVTRDYKRKTFYTLLGADFNNTKTSVKTIEVMTIQRGKPVFRDDQFLLGGTVEDRIVLEYSAELVATVRYNEALDMIVYDHLVPLHPLYHGNHQFYGSDGSYDGLRFTDGIWVLEEDVDARNQ
jgi:hypothetical protein